jgi:DNA polymerase III delta prime subunit
MIGGKDEAKEFPMVSTRQLDMPKDFAKRIHQALRAWHTQHAKDVLDDLLLAQQMRAARGRTAPRLISNQILMDGLDSLKQVDEGAADLLQRRFPNQETALKVAYRWNWSEDVVYQRQRVAIAQLAQLIWDQEVALRQERVREVEARLEPPTYSRLFGVAEKMTQVRARLETASEPWLMAFEGLGGIGKTSLADALARELACGTHFREVGWVSARQRLFRLSGDVESLAHQPDLTLGELVDRLIDQFGLADMRRWSDPDKLAGLRDFLRSRPCLVIVDNLETVADYDALVSQLGGLVGPSKFLITTRYSLRDVSGVYVMTLRQLSRDDTLALIRHEAETRGLHELARAPQAELEQIYDVTGGNPLATKLLIGQIHTLSLPLALTRFSVARGKPVEELLAFIYAHAWETLDQDSRRVLQAMLLVTREGGRLEQIAAASELGLDDAAACLQRLATLSLVNVGGGLKEKRYALHQLTQTFLARQSSEDG